MIRTHNARPVADAGEDAIPRAEIDFATGMVQLNGARWLAADDEISPQAVAKDARILVDYLDSFRSFFGNAEGAVEVYWAFLVWLYAAPAAPYLRQAAIPAGIDPWVYPVYAVLFGRSSGGKTLFTKIAARSMFGFEKMVRSGQFTANRALGLREKLGAIPLLIDDVTRDKFTSHVPDLVRTDHEMSACYAPIVLTTNRDVSSVPPDLTKRMVTCHIDAAIPENRSVTERIARVAQREIGTALYRTYLQRLIPEVRAMRAAIDAEPARVSGSAGAFLGDPARHSGSGARGLAGLGATARLCRLFRHSPPPLPRSADRYACRCRSAGHDQPAHRRSDDQLWRRHEPGRPVRPQRAGFRAEGPLRRSRQARSSGTGAGDGLRSRHGPDLVATPSWQVTDARTAARPVCGVRHRCRSGEDDGRSVAACCCVRA